MALTHGYDGLQRLRTKSYNDGTPAVTYEYYLSGNAPRVGRLKSVTTSAASALYTYDALGRVTASTRTVAGSPHSYGFLYTWLLNDGLATMRYPSGRTLTYTQDDAGRVVQVQDGSKLYAQGIGYTAHGAITQMQLGNGLVEQWLYNSRLQAARIRVGAVAGSDSVFGAEFNYGSTGNNGNPLSQRITGTGLDRTQTYQYDGVNRLTGAAEGTAWWRNFGYDQRGNGWVSTWSRISPSSFTPVTSNWFDAQNRLTGMGATYDGAGNQIAIGGYSFTYDGENRLKTSTINNSTTTYFYDGEGRRVKRVLPGGAQTLYVHDAMGGLAAEYASGQAAPPGTRYVTVDQLGSVRAVSGQDQTVLARRDYLPFGEEIPPPLGGRTGVWAADAGLAQKFAGKERDGETGLDYFPARYYSGAQGRWTSPDPFNIILDAESREQFDAYLAQPQNWNKYVYTWSNPLRYTDPTGEAVELLGDEEERKKALALIQRAVGSNAATSRLYINEVKDGNIARHFVGIKGDAGEFAQMGDAAQGLANLVQDKKVVEFGLTSQNLVVCGGNSVGYPIDLNALFCGSLTLEPCRMSAKTGRKVLTVLGRIMCIL